LVVVGVGLAVTYDIRVHGTFKRSITGRVLKDYGVVAVWNQGQVKTNYYWKHTSKWVSKNAPVYYDIANKSVGPYIRLFSDKVREVLLLAWEAAAPVRVWANKTIPPILEDITERYVPRILAVVQQFAVAMRQHLVDLGIWLQTNVFTGSLDLQNLQKLTAEIVSKAQVATVDAVQWISQQFTALTN